MARRMGWMLLCGLGAGLLVVRGVGRRRREAAERLGDRERPRLLREPEVVRGPVPGQDASVLERPLASAVPDAPPGRVMRAGEQPYHPSTPELDLFEPVVPDAPELRDPAEEPSGAEESSGGAAPVPPTVHRHS